MSLPAEAVRVPMGCVGANATACRVPMSVQECVCEVPLQLTGSAQEHSLDGVLVCVERISGASVSSKGRVCV